VAHVYAGGVFNLWGPVDEIRETSYGFAAAGGMITYPHVNSCTTITVRLSDGSAVGMHLTKGDPAASVDAIVAAMVAHIGTLQGVTAVSLYAVGVLRFRFNDGWMGEPRYSWPVLLSTFNEAFGLNPGATVRGYDQGFHPNGAAVDYRVTLAQNMTLWSQRAAGTQQWLPVALTNF
jgi:hypothetical protein